MPFWEYFRHLKNYDFKNYTKINSSSGYLFLRNIYIFANLLALQFSKLKELIFKWIHVNLSNDRDRVENEARKNGKKGSAFEKDLFAYAKVVLREKQFATNAICEISLNYANH